MTHWTDNLPDAACKKAVAWARTQPDAATAWATCTQGDWMIWLLEYIGGHDRELRLIACDSAESVLYLTRECDRTACAAAIAVARRFADGAATGDELSAARAAASAAAWAATRAAAWAAASAAARAAASAAASAAARAAARGAARGAAWDAARDAQRTIFQRLVDEAFCHVANTEAA